MNFQVLRIALCRAALLCAGLMTAGSATAGTPADPAIASKLKTTLETATKTMKVESVENSEIAGLYAVQFVNGPLIYSSAKGDHFVAGDMFRIAPNGFVNLAEQRRDGIRKTKLDKVATEEMIVFSPASTPKGVITVFTDITCFYCQKLHKEVPELNRRGVEVRYLAYPRAGLGSDGYRKLASAWCSADPQDALTRMKNKLAVTENVCSGNPVASQFQLGQELGVNGTPAIVTESGEMLPGYQTADELIAKLGLN
ncbi:MAG: DsbC family protein [Halioglobus sp.]